MSMRIPASQPTLIPSVATAANEAQLGNSISVQESRFKTESGTENQIPPAVKTTLEELLKKPDFVSMIHHMEDLVQTQKANNKQDGWIKTNNNVYANQGYILQLGFNSMLEDLSNKLKITNAIGVKVAPQLTAYIPINRHHGLMVTHLEDDTSGISLPYVEILKRGMTLSPEAKAQFMADMKALTEVGYKHPYASRGHGNWLWNESSQRVHLNCWEVLTPFIRPEDKNQYLASIQALLNTK
ncbi:MAG: hypothetical protein K2X66_07365 [Cyanobacteria bacterium]|nr:hypothetical protein [Cyanobacteriota bacterium]